MSVPFNKYNCLPQDLGRKVHNLHTDTLKVALTNAAPDAATHTVLANITEIAAANGYTAGGTAPATHSYSQTGGVAKLAADDVVFQASGGSFGPFRYSVLYNATAAGGPLIGWWDRGSSVTLNDPDTFTQDFTDNTNALQLS